MTGRKPLTQELEEIRDSNRLPLYAIRRVEDARVSASAYVWGRQDAGESARDTGYSLTFAETFARRRLDYELGKRGSLPDLKAAFIEFQVTGTIV